MLRNLAVDNGVEAGWFWITRTSTALVEILLTIGSLDNLDNVKMGVLRLISRMDVDLEFAQIKGIVDQSDSLVATTALEVYGQHAPHSDVEELEEYVEHESSDIAEAAWQAVLAILARHEPEQAIDWLRKPTPLRRRNVAKLMAPVWSRMSKDSVRVLLEDESSLVRRKAFEVIKNDLTEDNIRKFTEDEDSLMQAAAYMELVRKGVRVDKQELEESLEGIESQTSYSSGDAHEEDNSPPTYTLDDVLLELYRKLPYEDLERGITWFSTHGELRYEALADSYFEEFKETLRNDISQDFKRLKDQFYAERQAIVSRAPDDARDKLNDELIDQLKRYDDLRFELFRRAAYRVLAKHAEPSDVQFARSLLSDLRSKYFREELVQAAVEIVKKHGNADDAELLKPLLSATYPDVKSDGAEVILQLATSNRSENIHYLVEMDDPDVIRGVLRYSLESPDGLLLDEAYNLLFNVKEQIRLDTLAFLTHKLSRENFESLLDEYPNTQNFYYYNVVSWLDRLLYAPGNLRDVYTAKLKRRLIN